MDDVTLFRFERNNVDEMRTLLVCALIPLKPKLKGVEEERQPFYTVRGTEVVLLNGFRWNGASGPTIDGPATEIASAVHDCLYMAMHAGVIPMSNRARADKNFRRILKMGGMWWPRRWYWWLGVRLVGRAWMESGRT